MIVWAGSFPRSGSTLWRIVWHTCTGLPTYSYANDPMLRKVKEIGQKRLPRPFREMGQHEKDEHIYMIKAHLHPATIDYDNRSRKLFIVRDVRDTVVSLAHYTTWRKKLDFTSELQRIVDNTQWLGFYDAWTEATETMVRFEDLLQDPRAEAERVVKELNIPVRFQQAAWPSFRQLHKDMPKFFRKGKIGRWRDVLSEAQEAQLWEQFGHKMESLGYERGQA